MGLNKMKGIKDTYSEKSKVILFKRDSYRVCCDIFEMAEIIQNTWPKGWESDF